LIGKEGEQVKTCNRSTLQIDDPVLAERRDFGTSFGIQFDQTIAQRHILNPLVAFALGPIRQNPS